MSNEPGCAFEQSENTIEPNANQRGLQASLDHLLRGLPSCHTLPLSPIHLAGKGNYLQWFNPFKNPLPQNRVLERGNKRGNNKKQILYLTDS
jgi:hypothetical protein